MPDTADPRLYHYRADVLNVVDGDTLDARIDLGLRLSTVQRLRVLGINAPETHGPRACPEGAAATAFARSLLSGQTVLIRTHKSDDFGRWLAQVTLPDGQDFATLMLTTGHAVPYLLERP